MLADMKKVMVIGHRSDRHALLRELHKSRMVEIIKTRPIDDTIRLDNTEKMSKFQDKINKLQFAFKFLKDCHNAAKKAVVDAKKNGTEYSYKQIKEPMFSNVKIMGYDEFMDISTREVEILALVSELEDINQKMISLTAEKNKIETENKSLEIYSNVKAAFSSFQDTNKVSIYLGTIENIKIEALKEALDSNDNLEYEIIEGDIKTSVVAIAVLKEYSEEVFAKLHELESDRCQINLPQNASELINANNDRIKEIDNSYLDLLTEAVEKQKFIRDFKTLYDYYSLRIQRLEAVDCFAATDRSFVLEGWYPAKEEQKLQEILDSVSATLVYEFQEPEEGAIQPTLVKQNRFFDPFQGVTNMYAPPLKGTDIDPTIFVAFFYFLFFGLMLADAAYGLILMIGGLVLYRLMKPAPGRGNLILLISMCGLSTFIWGAVFGSWFAIEIPEGSFLDQIIWLKPLDADGAVMMLILSYLLGFIHILTGIIINGIHLCRQKQVMAAFGHSFSWVFVFIGLIIFAFNMVISLINMLFSTSIVVDLPSWLKYVGIAFIGLGVLCIIAFSSSNKNPLKRIFGGVAKLYDGVSILSDILSYSRLFGLGLASGVVGLVVNEVAKVFIGLIPYAGYVVAAVILLIGHVFNLAINTLGAYIHDCRLQYIEFFGKFYTGGGHIFTPYGSKTKYTYIDTTK